jgi:hypothetical protein
MKRIWTWLHSLFRPARLRVAPETVPPTEVEKIVALIRTEVGDDWMSHDVVSRIAAAVANRWIPLGAFQHALRMATRLREEGRLRVPASEYFAVCMRQEFRRRGLSWGNRP